MLVFTSSEARWKNYLLLECLPEKNIYIENIYL
jgi:hypothetical protein